MKIYTEAELKETFPQSWAKRNKYGQVDEKKIANPLHRPENTWSEADHNYVKELVKGNADRIMKSGQPDAYNQMLIDELARRKTPSNYSSITDEQLEGLLT